MSATLRCDAATNATTVLLLMCQVRNLKVVRCCDKALRWLAKALTLIKANGA